MFIKSVFFKVKKKHEEKTLVSSIGVSNFL